MQSQILAVGLLLAAGAFCLAAVAIVRVAALQRKLTTLSQSYWDLRYEFGRQRARLAKLDGGPAGAEPEDPTEAKI